MTLFEVLTAAVADMVEHGFDSEERVSKWVEKIRQAALKSLLPESTMQIEVERALTAAYTRLVTKGGMINSNVSKYTIDRLKPKLRAELDRRIIASVNLIKLNRQEAISNTLRRFQGWATSIPIGGTKITDRAQQKKAIRASLGKAGFEQRRVVIDQTHKLVSSLNEIVAVDNGAIAARWHSHWRQPHYHFRKDHKERDDKVFVIRDTWATEKGLLKAPNGYTDEITSPGEEVYCRCNYVYLYNLRQVEGLLTKKGKTTLQSTRVS